MKIINFWWPRWCGGRAANLGPKINYFSRLLLFFILHNRRMIRCGESLCTCFHEKQVYLHIHRFDKLINATFYHFSFALTCITQDKIQNSKYGFLKHFFVLNGFFKSLMQTLSSESRTIIAEKL